MKKSVVVCAIACLLVAGACITESDPVLYVNVYSTVPDTTHEDQIEVAGEIVRVPSRQGLVTVVRVAGGAAPAIDTATQHGLFTVDVALLTNSDNALSITASDNTGAVTPTPATKTIVHLDAPSPSQRSTDGQH